VKAGLEDIIVIFIICSNNQKINWRKIKNETR
jgi:hypothetical protein